MLTNLLVTGFGPFDTVETNTSELIVHELQNFPLERDGFCLRTRIFPVIYETASEEIMETILKTSPEIFIMIGVSVTAKELQLEQVARNLDCSETFDNQNVARKNHRILDDGPDQYLTSLPLDEYTAVLKQAGIPTRVSNHAGGFLCNHYYYRACHHFAVASIDCICLFVHVPNLVNGETIPLHITKLTVSGAANGILLLAQQIKERTISNETMG